MSQPAIAIHGGAGGLAPGGLSPEREAIVRAALHAALSAGWRVLSDGGSALDATVEAVVVLEDCPELNAGRGAVLRSDGSVSLDASVMVGSERRAGAVAAVRRLRNPILGARAVMQHSDHVLFAGERAESFASQHGVRIEPQEYFVTPLRSAERQSATHSRAASRPSDQEAGNTVGAVARDAAGGLAAATSTGGMTNSDPGRVGDSPIHGAGIWADDATCAVSGTGWGELFMRSAFAHEVDAQLRLRDASLRDACAAALARVRDLGGRGGCAAIDASGRIELPFTTRAMPRGLIGPDGAPRIALFDEALSG